MSVLIASIDHFDLVFFKASLRVRRTISVTHSLAVAALESRLYGSILRHLKYQTILNNMKQRLADFKVELAVQSPT